MRDSHPGTSFLQYKTTHFHDPKAAGCGPAPTRLYRCRLCFQAVPEAQIKSHLVRLHHAALQCQQDADNEADDEIQVLEVIPKSSERKPASANPLRRPTDSQTTTTGHNGNASSFQRRQVDEDGNDSDAEDGDGKKEEEDEVVPRKRPRPARMFYNEPYNFFRDEPADDDLLVITFPASKL